MPEKVHACTLASPHPQHLHVRKINGTSMHNIMSSQGLPVEICDGKEQEVEHNDCFVRTTRCAFAATNKVQAAGEVAVLQ
jgi:hypothetical protein